MNDLSIIETNDAGDHRVSGRRLHKPLRVVAPYTMWFPRMCDYGFFENTDFWTDHKNVIRADGTQMPQQVADHMPSIDMVKRSAFFILFGRTLQLHSLSSHAISARIQYRDIDHDAANHAHGYFTT